MTVSDTVHASDLVPPPETRPPKVRSRGSRSMFDRAIVKRGRARRVPQARPARPGPQPGHVRRARGQRLDDRAVPPRRVKRNPSGQRVRRARRCLLVVHGPVRQLRRGDGRRSWQGPSRHPAQDPFAKLSPRSVSPTVPRRPSRRRSCRSAICACAIPATSSRATAMSSKASPRSTSPPSPASRRQ